MEPHIFAGYICCFLGGSILCSKLFPLGVALSATGAYLILGYN